MNFVDDMLQALQWQHQVRSKCVMADCAPGSVQCLSTHSQADSTVLTHDTRKGGLHLGVPAHSHIARDLAGCRAQEMSACRPLRVT